FFNSTGDDNTAMGDRALFNNDTADENTAVGAQVLFNNTGQGNTAIGFQALYSNTGSHYNTAVGFGALGSNTGSDNTAIGEIALNNNTTGTVNTALGAGAGIGVNTANNVICIGAAGADVDNSCYISNIWNQPGGSQAVFVNADGKLGAQVSSRRFKEEIRPMEDASQALFALKPVSFRYKKEIDSTGTAQFGLVAEDVEKVNPDLVVHDKDGKPYSVRYDQVNAMLLHEFLKEHRNVRELESTAAKQETTIGELRCTTAEQETTIEELKSTVAQQQKSFQSKLAKQEKQIEALTSGLQKVSAEIEVNRLPPQVVVNGP